MRIITTALFTFIFLSANAISAPSADIEVTNSSVSLYFSKNKKGADYQLLYMTKNHGMDNPYIQSTNAVHLNYTKDGVQGSCVAREDKHPEVFDLFKEILFSRDIYADSLLVSFAYDKAYGMLCSRAEVGFKHLGSGGMVNIDGIKHDDSQPEPGNEINEFTLGDIVL